MFQYNLGELTPDQIVVQAVQQGLLAHLPNDAIAPKWWADGNDNPMLCPLATDELDLSGIFGFFTSMVFNHLRRDDSEVWNCMDDHYHAAKNAYIALMGGKAENNERERFLLSCNVRAMVREFVWSTTRDDVSLEGMKVRQAMACQLLVPFNELLASLDTRVVELDEHRATA